MFWFKNWIFGEKKSFKKSSLMQKKSIINTSSNKTWKKSPSVVVLVYIMLHAPESFLQLAPELCGNLLYHEISKCGMGLASLSLAHCNITLYYILLNEPRHLSFRIIHAKDSIQTLKNIVTCRTWYDIGRYLSLDVKGNFFHPWGKIL